jgi:hypothetical protein
MNSFRGHCLAPLPYSLPPTLYLEEFDTSRMIINCIAT